MYAFRNCPDCCAKLDAVDGDAERLVPQTCAACGAVHLRNAKPCAGALVGRDGQVLLGRRAVEPGLGSWDIPGGFLNPWEHPSEAAVREVREETGLQVRLLRAGPPEMAFGV
jgi:8-oxo-dGTP diphosphatase